MSLTPEDFRKAGWGPCGPVVGIAPHLGWTPGLLDEARGHRCCDEYVALHEDGRSVLLGTSRFDFHLTQERWNWLVEHGFPTAAQIEPCCIVPITDSMIDNALLRRRAA